MILEDHLQAVVGEDGSVRDQYERSAEACATSADIASDAADDLRTLVAFIADGSVTLGRLGGDRQVKRLEASAETFERIAARDRDFAADLEAAGERTRGVHASAEAPAIRPIPVAGADSQSAADLVDGQAPRGAGVAW